MRTIILFIYPTRFQLNCILLNPVTPVINLQPLSYLNLIEIGSKLSQQGWKGILNNYALIEIKKQLAVFCWLHKICTPLFSIIENKPFWPALAWKILTWKVCHSILLNLNHYFWWVEIIFVYGNFILNKIF